MKFDQWSDILLRIASGEKESVVQCILHAAKAAKGKKVRHIKSLTGSSSPEMGSRLRKIRIEVQSSHTLS